MTTNYYNTLIQISEDSPIAGAEVPVVKNDKSTVASMQYDMVVNNPYKFTSDDVIFDIFARRNDVEPSQAEREKFFSKGQPCFRSSPLGKRYGWGVHSNTEGKIAIYPADSSEYKRLASDSTVKQLKAMRSKRA